MEQKEQVKKEIKDYLKKSVLEGKFESVHGFLSKLIIKLTKEKANTTINLEEYIRELYLETFKPETIKSSTHTFSKNYKNSFIDSEVVARNTVVLETLQNILNSKESALELREGREILRKLVKEKLDEEKEKKEMSLEENPKKPSDEEDEEEEGEEEATDEKKKKKKKVYNVFPRSNSDINKSSMIPNLLDDYKFFKEGGIGFEETELFSLQLSIKNFFLKKTKEEYASMTKIIKKNKIDISELYEDEDPKMPGLIKQIRFIGKILGLEKNYYIIETNYLPITKDDIERCGQKKELGFNTQVSLNGTINPTEEPKIGANKYSYFVCNTVGANGGDWTRLPDVTPAQICISRNIKKYLTGNLTHPINSYPRFPGNEANYLRCQIARIVSSTWLCPKGVMQKFEMQEEEEGEEEETTKLTEEEKLDIPTLVVNESYGEAVEGEEGEEGGTLSFTDLLSLDNWVHMSLNIMQTGRVTKFVPPKAKKEGEEEGEEEEPEEEGEEEEGKQGEKQIPILTPIGKDNPLLLENYLLPFEPEEEEKTEGEGEEEGENEEEEEGEDEEDTEKKDELKKEKVQSWRIKSIDDVSKKYASVIVKSLRWPGSYSYCSVENPLIFGSVYVGYGLKTIGESNVFTPLLPPPIQEDIPAYTQITDPQPGDEKRIIMGDKIEEEGEEEEGEEEEEE